MAAPRRVEWDDRFTPNKGVTEEDAARLFQRIYDDGLKALAVCVAKKK